VNRDTPAPKEEKTPRNARSAVENSMVVAIARALRRWAANR
jgi:hypothetical protein